jgi:hypothetical protein
MTRDAVTEVFDIECTLEARSEESTEWRHERRKDREDEEMDMERGVRDSRNRSSELFRFR